MIKFIEKLVSLCSTGQGVTLSGMCLGVSLYGVLSESPMFVWWAYGAILISGVPIVWSALKGVLTEHRITSALLISIAMVACVAIGEIFAAGEVAFIMALGEKLEDLTVARARKGMAALVGLMPRQARKVVNGKIEEIAPESICPGDVLRVLPGEIIPADGEVTEGVSTVNQSVMTGESLPVEKRKGDGVYAGTLNEHGSLDVLATATPQDTVLQQLIRLVCEADARKAPLQRTVDKWASWLVPIALLLAALAYLFTADIERAVTVLVVFCPCALALATPTSVVAAIGQASRNGVLIKSGEALERMAKVSCFALDKTGTLTYGNLCVYKVISLSPLFDARKLLTTAAAVEARSEHPIAKAIVNYARSQDLTVPRAYDFQMEPGIGVQARVGEHSVFCGRATEGEEAADSILQQLRMKGLATLVVRINGEIAGIICLSDTIRAGAEDMVQQLRQQNCHIMLLTGDCAVAAEQIARKMAIHDVHASLLPLDKLNIISAAEAKGQRICMLGDGVNDAPALKQSYIGVAMGGMGSEIAREAADIVLMSEELDRVPYIKRLAKATLNTIRFNLTASMVINVIAIALSVAGILGPVTGALVHNVGSVLVVLNAALLYERNFR